MKITSSLFLFIGAISWPCWSVSSAGAQPLSPHARSIEDLTANSDMVFIAQIEKFAAKKAVDGRTVHDVTIAIAEVLKRDIYGSGPQPRMSMTIPHGAATLADWQKRSCRLLVAYDDFTPHATTVFELAKGKMQMMTAELKLLRDPEDVITVVKETVRRMPSSVKRIHTFDLSVPLKNVTGTTWAPYYKTGGHLRLRVPADKQLEKRALDSVRSKSNHKRAEGARALRYFKSDEHIALLRPLLADTEPTYTQAYKGIEERVYGVRHEAYATLKAWGVAVKKPIVREKVKIES